MNLIQKKIKQREKITEIYIHSKDQGKKNTKWKRFMSEIREKLKLFNYVENFYGIYIVNYIIESKINRNCNFTTI